MHLRDGFGVRSRSVLVRAAFLSAVLLSLFFLDRIIPQNAWADSGNAWAESGVIVKLKNGGIAKLSEAELRSFSQLRQGVGAISPRLGTALSDRTGPCAEMEDLVEYCEEDFPIYSHGVPNDPLLTSQWAISPQSKISIDVAASWESPVPDREVVVAVIDSGMDYEHPDLRDSVWTNPGEIAGNGIDDDANGYIDDVHGIDVWDGDSTPQDDAQHGTHVAGIIGATMNNSTGIVGVAPRAKLLPVRFLSAQGSGSMYGAVKALEYVIDLRLHHGVNIVAVNTSWGGPSYSRALEEALMAAASAGILVVASAGNDGYNNDLLPNYPSGYNVSNIISVGALDADGNLAPYSNFGASSVHVAAPGTEILSTVPGGSYATLSGTSMAAPHVSGAIAVLATMSSLTSTQLRARVLQTGRELTNLKGIISSGKMLNIDALVRDVVLPDSRDPNLGITISPPLESPGISIIPSQSITTMEPGVRYDFVVEAPFFERVSLRFTAGSRRCEVKRFYSGLNGTLVNFKVPANAPSGAAILEAFDHRHLLGDRLELSIGAATRKRARSNPTPWCKLLKRTARRSQ